MLIKINRISVNRHQRDLLEDTGYPTAELHRSLETHGMREPIVVDSALIVINGHRRLEWATAKGRTEIECIVCPDALMRKVLACKEIYERHGYYHKDMHLRLKELFNHVHDHPTP